MENFRERSTCPVCDSTDFSVVFECPYTAPAVVGFLTSHYRGQGEVDFTRLEGTDYVVALCAECDLLFQVTIPTDAMLDYVYNHLIAPQSLEAIERKLVTLDSVDKIVGEMAVLFRMTGKAPTDITLLDYGLGYGRYARVARGMGATVYATEIGEEKRQIAASLGIRVIDDAAIDTMKFDIVHTEQVLEHLTHPGRDFARLARASGILFKAAVPARGDAQTLLAKHGLPSVSPYTRVKEGGKPAPTDNAYISIQPLEHLNAFSPATMRWLSARHGLDLVSRVRMGTVGVDVSSPGQFVKSMVKVARMAAKAIVPPNNGYYLFRRPQEPVAVTRLA